MVVGRRRPPAAWNTHNNQSRSQESNTEHRLPTTIPMHLSTTASSAYDTSYTTTNDDDDDDNDDDP